MALDVSELFSYQNPHRAHYNYGGGSKNQEDYTEHFIVGLGHVLPPKRQRDVDQLVAFFKEQLEGSLLFDVGCGADTPFFQLASQWGVRHYLGVDHIFGLPSWRQDWEVYTCQTIHTGNGNDLERILVKGDLLLALSHVKEGSGAVVVNGVDYSCLLSFEYLEDLAREISRIVRPGSIVFGIGSYPLSQMEKNGLKKILLPGNDITKSDADGSMDLAIYEKLI